MKKANILLMNPRFYPAIGGIETYLMEIGKEFVKQGHHVTVLCTKHRRSLKTKEIINGIEIRRLPYLKGMFLFPHLLRLLYKTAFHFIPRIRKPDILLTRNSQMARIFNRKFNCKKMFVLSSYYPELSLYQSNRYPLPIKAFYRCYTHRIACQDESRIISSYKLVVFSNLMKNKILDNYGVRDIKVIPPGINPDRFSKKRLSRNEIANGKIKEKDFLILSVGRLSSVKNYDLFIETIGKLNNNVKGIIVGSGLEEKRLRQKIKRLNLSDKVFLEGQKDNIADYYLNSDLYLLCSYSESFGQAAMEAMSSGLPILSIDNGNIGLNELIRNNKNGFLIRDVNPKRLADKVNELMNDKRLLRTVGQESKRYFSRIDMTSHSKKILDFCREK